MTTFWKRLREMIYGDESAEQEIGSLLSEEVSTAETTEPVRVDDYGKTIAVHYSGPLSQSGRPIYVHYGYGPGPWSDVRETMMHQVARGVFEAEIPLTQGAGPLEFCFRNDLGEWDNNDGENWSYRV